MARTINAETRHDLLQAIRQRYRGGLKEEKLRILNEFVAVTGYHRKHAIRLFNTQPGVSGGSRRARLPVYDDAVRKAVVVLWEASDRVCGKRLKPLLPILVSALERHGHLALDATVRVGVLSASAATLDRLLRPTRASVSGQRVRRRAMPAVQRSVPVRTFADWEEPMPGDMEADLVSHGGESTAGSFVHTLTLTDVASGWTECVALVVRDGALVAAALEHLRTSMPFRFGVRMQKKAETSRDRRLSRDEERKRHETALASMNTIEHGFVGALLHDRIVGALELCCRRGEMLLIQNKRVNWDSCQIGIPGATAKDRENRRIPFNPKGRLAAILKRRSTLGSDAYVFGSVSGAFQPNIQTAWETLRLLALGEPRPKKASVEWSRAQLQRIDLRWHDLRHEGACRLLADGVDIRIIQLMLGHASIQQTQRYLNVTDEELRRGLEVSWDRPLRAVSGG